MEQQTHAVTDLDRRFQRQAGDIAGVLLALTGIAVMLLWTDYTIAGAVLAGHGTGYWRRGGQIV